MGANVFTDWTSDPKHDEQDDRSSQNSSNYDADERGPPKGTDKTYNIGELLKTVTRSIHYGQLPQITVEKMPVPGGWLIHNLLSPEECKQYIELSEEMGFAPAPLRNLDQVNSNNFTYNEDTQSIRTSLRVLFDVPDDIGVVLNDRIAPHLPPELECEGYIWRPSTKDDLCGGPINKRWRFNKYRKGDFFKPHFDAGYEFSENEVTILTFILYLNEGFEGGETIFYPDNKKLAWSKPEPGIEFKVVPKTGSAIIFFQRGRENPRHEGATQRSEDKFKYILRSDIGYVKKRKKEEEKTNV